MVCYIHSDKMKKQSEDHLSMEVSIEIVSTTYFCDHSREPLPVECNILVV